MRAVFAGCLIGALLPACDVVFGLDGPWDHDHDRDGVDDAIDNCPGIANADQQDGDQDAVGDACDTCPELFDDQHDEDGDGIGDRCDSCPHVADAGGLGPNADGDDLGDQCDDSAGVDCIALFDGFGAEPDNWDLAASSGTWSIEGDAMVQANAAVTAKLDSVGSFEKPSIELGATATTLGALPRSVGVWGRTDTIAPDLSLMVETIVRTNDPTNLALIATGFTPLSNVKGATSIVPKRNLTPNAPISLRLDLREANVLARGDVGRSTSTLQFAFSPPSGHVALRTINVTARFDYILVVTRSTTATCPPR